MAQHPVAKPVVGDRPQLLLDRLERTTQRRAPGKRILHVNRPGVEPNRKQAGEPANRPRQVDVGKNLLPTMTLKVEQNPRPLTAPAPPAPPQNRNRQTGQQNLVDPPMERRRNPRQQAPSVTSAGSVSADAPPPHNVASPIQRPLDQANRLPPASPARTPASATRRDPAHAPQADAPSRETTSRVRTRAECPPQSPPTPPQGREPGSATTPRQPTR